MADDKSRKAVRRARRASPGAALIVTGCSVQVGRAAFAAVDPEARLVGNDEKDGLLAEVERLLGLPGHDVEAPHGPLDAPLPTLAGVEIAGIVDDRTRIDRTRAYVKVQDGCSFFCTFCIIPRARGPERSLAPEVVLADVRRALAAGHREIVLTGINVGTYDGGSSERGFRGAHASAALSLAGAGPADPRRDAGRADPALLHRAPARRRRAPRDVDRRGRRALPAPLPPAAPVGRRRGAAADGPPLRRGRVRARSSSACAQRSPAWRIHADAIAGFPTEDEAAFERSLAFIHGLDLAGLHVFRYSSRPGTPATRMAGQVPDAVRRERAAAMLAEASAARARFAARSTGGRRRVLFEEPVDDADTAGDWIGHAEDYVVVRVPAPGGRPLEGEIGVVVVAGPDPTDAERVVGRVERLVPRVAGARRALPVVPLP